MFPKHEWNFDINSQIGRFKILFIVLNDLLMRETGSARWVGSTPNWMSDTAGYKPVSNFDPPVGSDIVNDVQPAG